MATHTDVDYSTQPRGFQGGAPEDVDEIKVILERLDGHGDAIAIPSIPVYAKQAF
jgi:hypothetical protein